jgi:hypothetical protein
MRWFPRACPICRGDLHDDPEDLGVVACFMCGRSFDLAAPPGTVHLLAIARDPRAVEAGPGTDPLPAAFGLEARLHRVGNNVRV